MANNNNPNSMMRYAGLATQWMVLLLVAMWGGMKLDKLLAWSIPICTILFPLVAIIYSLWKLIQDFNQPKK